ncbi:hypothetical protein [Candidatus Roseilinea sp. NK_OTU-006]|jgi:hypothetical protein|uniref:hypothetical protein n=1 Tax=Candidatus Roseilinea sp. NK_OTU-006 TaxID=2704250 RepID=UPI00145D942F|nr:hypothetical protein [Candidatus Roseilinea sp. NK_OTU-006]
MKAHNKNIRPLGMVAAAALVLATVLPAPGQAMAQDEAPNGLAQPQAVDGGEIWTPGAGASFNLLQSPHVVVRVDAPYELANVGSYFIYDPINGYGPANPVTPTLSLGGKRAVMTATLDAGAVVSGSMIYFELPYTSTAQVASSPTYLLTKQGKAYLPFVVRTPPDPQPLSNTGESACDAANGPKGGPLQPNKGYQVLNPTTNSWMFAHNTTPNATIVVSLTNYTAVGQLQVFADQGNCNALTPLMGMGTNPNPVVTVYNVPVGRVYFRVASGSGQPAPPPYIIRWQYSTAPGPHEPNNNPCDATPLPHGLLLNTRSEDQYDFFKINITGAVQIRVQVLGHAISGAQVQVRSPLKSGYVCPGSGADPINSTNRIDPYGVIPSSGDATITVTVPASGTYYLRVSLPSGAPAYGQPYSIRWDYAGPSGGTAGPIFTSNPNQPPTCDSRVLGNTCQGDILFNINTGQTATYYWFGLQALQPYDSVQVKVIGVSNLVGCGLGNASATNPNTFANVWASVGTTAPMGSISIQFNATGGYNIEFRVMHGGVQKYHDGKPLKVGCGTSPSASEPLGTMADPPWPNVEPHP